MLAERTFSPFALNFFSMTPWKISGATPTRAAKAPSAVRQSPEVVRVYARLLVEHGEHATAEKTISRALKHHWDSELVRLYGLLESTNPQGQLRQAESWLPAHPEDPELLLCLGRLSARDKLWGKARDYFESSYRLERRPETCAELGRLLVALEQGQRIV